MNVTVTSQGNVSLIKGHKSEQLTHAKKKLPLQDCTLLGLLSCDVIHIQYFAMFTFFFLYSSAI